MAKSISRARLEKEVERWTIERFPDALVLKLYKRDWPDRLFLLPKGRAFFVEFKREGEKLRPGQRLAKKRLEEQGFRVHVIDSQEQGQIIIQYESIRAALER